MKKKTMTRRDMLIKAAPAAAVMSAGLGALAQQAQSQENQPQTGVSPRSEPGRVVKMMAQQSFFDGKYQLPPLPYPPDALEPQISARIIKLHHDVLHRGYVNGLNATIAKIDQLARAGNYDQVQLAGLMRDLSYNGGGDTLHCLYWTTMAPAKEGPNEPEGEIAEAINARYGSFDQFKTFFTQVALTTKDSGWAVLIYEPIGDAVGVFQVGDHDLHVVAGTQPILTVDVWEHAYYLQYENRRGEYLNAWWNLVNWPAVNEMYTFFRQACHMASNMQT